MKVSLAAFIALGILLPTLDTKASAMGKRAQVFEASQDAGIWDHGSEFYLRMDLADLADLRDQKFVWAGFQLESGEFKGQVVANQFDKNERSFPARAKVLSSTPSGRYFLIEVLNETNEVIKEIFVKGPALNLLER